MFGSSRAAALKLAIPSQQGRDHVPVVGRQRGDHVGLRHLHVLQHPEQLLVELGDEVVRPLLDPPGQLPGELVRVGRHGRAASPWL
jgi:hypothetical protein